ncbi:hypothetical protein [Cohnella silvisoli]|uniref:Uncharacterized protein n=1 Tax=Cohnella silvisoli TaxID=2873699 RepID=A0ABV1L2U2_9BACL|nr:hypothetical protein [Cohnella silvisoli]MCD9025995.1 hypothetical protein [Cohnella silvisoli]
MLIHDYTAYKIWESDQRERELELARRIGGSGIKVSTLPVFWLIALASKLSNLNR